MTKNMEKITKPTSAASRPKADDNRNIHVDVPQMNSWNHQYSARVALPDIVANFLVMQVFTASENDTIIVEINHLNSLTELGFNIFLLRSPTYHRYSTN